MAELISIAAVQVIAKVAFDKFLEGSAIELGRKTTDNITKLIRKLGETIWLKAIKGKPKAEKALAEAAQESSEDFQKLENYLNALWKADEAFGEEIQTLVQEIHQTIQFEEVDAENVMNVFSGGTGHMYNNKDIHPNSSVQQGNISNYYGIKPD